MRTTQLVLHPSLLVMEEAAVPLMIAHLTETFAVLITIPIPIPMDTASTALAILEPVEVPLPDLLLDPSFGAASGSGASDGGAALDREL